MQKYSTAQTVRAMVLFAMAGGLLLPTLAWAEAENTARLPLENASTLSLSLSETSAADWDGLTKDTAGFMGYQLSIIGVLYVMPASISGWTDETKKDFSIQQYKDNARQVVWDKDDWWINYVLHPYWGGTYYVRAQERGFGPLGSFIYSATLSGIYEFGAEAFFEKPSIQDLIVTPGAGYFVGQYFMGVRANIQKKSAGQMTGTDKLIMVVTDPIGAMNKEVESWFGGKTEVSLRPMIGPQFRTPIVNETRFKETNQLSYTGTSNFGIKMSMRW